MRLSVDDIRHLLPLCDPVSLSRPRRGGRAGLRGLVRVDVGRSFRFGRRKLRCDPELANTIDEVAPLGVVAVRRKRQSRFKGMRVSPPPWLEKALTMGLLATTAGCSIESGTGTAAATLAIWSALILAPIIRRRT